MCVLYAIIFGAIGGISARVALYIGVGILQIFTGWERETCDAIINIGTAIGAILIGIIGFCEGLERDEEISEKNNRLQVEKNKIKYLKAQKKQISDPNMKRAIKDEINSVKCRMWSIKSEYDHSDSLWDSSSSSSSDKSYEPIEFRYKDIYDESYNKVGYYDTHTNESYTLGGVVTHRYDESTGEIQDGNYRKIGSYDSRTGTLYNNGNVRIGDYDENTGTIYSENHLRKGHIE